MEESIPSVKRLKPSNRQFWWERPGYCHPLQHLCLLSSWALPLDGQWTDHSLPRLSPQAFSAWGTNPLFPIAPPMTSIHHSPPPPTAPWISFPGVPQSAFARDLGCWVGAGPSESFSGNLNFEQWSSKLENGPLPFHPPHSVPGTHQFLPTYMQVQALPPRMFLLCEKGSSPPC